MAKYYIGDRGRDKLVYICDSGKEGGDNYKKTIITVFDSNYELAEKIVDLLNKNS